MIQFSASAAVSNPATAATPAAGTAPKAAEGAAVGGFAALLELLGDEGLAGARGIALPQPDTVGLPEDGSEDGPKDGKVGKQTGKTVPDEGDNAGPDGPATGLDVEDVDGDNPTPACSQPVTVTLPPDPAAIGLAFPVAPIAATVPPATRPEQGTVPAQAGRPAAPPSRTVAVVAGVPLASLAPEQISLAPVTIVAAPIAAAALPQPPLAADVVPMVPPAHAIAASAASAAPDRVEPTEATLREHSARFAPPPPSEPALAEAAPGKSSLHELAPRTRAGALLATAPSEPAEVAFRPGGDALAVTTLPVPNQMSLAAPPTPVGGQANASPQQPQDFDTLVGRLSEAREAAMPHIVRTAMHHGQFGQVSLEFRHEDGGLAVTMASSAPGFNGSVQAAVAANLANDQPRDSGQPSTPHQSAHAGLVNSGGAGTEQRQQGDGRGGAERQWSGQSDADPSRAGYGSFRQKQAAGNRTSDPADRDDGRGGIYA